MRLISFPLWKNEPRLLFSPQLWNDMWSRLFYTRSFVHNKHFLTQVLIQCVVSSAANKWVQLRIWTHGLERNGLHVLLENHPVVNVGNAEVMSVKVSHRWVDLQSVIRCCAHSLCVVLEQREEPLRVLEFDSRLLQPASQPQQAGCTLLYAHAVFIVIYVAGGVK